jgi:hypothetical protein
MSITFIQNRPVLVSLILWQISTLRMFFKRQKIQAVFRLSINYKDFISLCTKVNSIKEITSKLDVLWHVITIFY